VFYNGYKCPKRVEFVETLPRTATGKLQKFRECPQLGGATRVGTFNEQVWVLSDERHHIDR